MRASHFIFETVQLNDELKIKFSWIALPPVVAMQLNFSLIQKCFRIFEFNEYH